MFKSREILNYEKRSVFLINFVFVVFVIISLLYGYSLKYFFYFNVLFTLVVAYFFFKRSKKLARSLIVTNMFIFFYFLYPNVASFFSEMFDVSGYIFIIFYNVLIAYSFLIFSGNRVKFLRNLKKFNMKIWMSVVLLGLTFGLLFVLIKEPVPSIFLTNSNIDLSSMVGFLLFSSFVIAFSEQIIFSGFLYNVYSGLNSKADSIYQVSIIFVLFHILRFEILVRHYFTNFNDLFLFYITVYYVLLFLFMLCALYLYSFKSKEYEGNFIYPLTLHFMADFGLFLFYALGV